MKGRVIRIIPNEGTPGILSIKYTLAEFCSLMEAMYKYSVYAMLNF